MNVTERVIAEQFPFWEEALEVALPSLSGRVAVVVGCGSSYHLAQSVAAALNLSGRDALAVTGAEWARRPAAYLADRSGAEVVALSRSGESSETIQAVEASRKAGLHTIAITCEGGSSIVRAAAETLFLPTHPLEGIVMTASTSLMLIAGLRMAGIRFDPGMAAAAEAAMRMADAGLAPLLQGRSHFVYLGAGPLHGLAAEGSLKLQEMSLSHSQAFHPMEYRHGPISLVDDRTLAVMLYDAETGDEEARVAEDIADKGGAILGFGGPGALSVALRTGGPARAVEILPSLQILGERVAGVKGIDTTAPRHLSKVVVLA